jgi:hypothetical protein
MEYELNKCIAVALLEVHDSWEYNGKNPEKPTSVTPKTL